MIIVTIGDIIAGCIVGALLVLFLGIGIDGWVFDLLNPKSPAQRKWATLLGLLVTTCIIGIVVGVGVMIVRWFK